MRTFIKCTGNNMGGHSFYINHDGVDYLLFNQRYHTGVNRTFKNGIDLTNSLNPKTAKGDTAVLKTISKMKPYIKFIEKEYQVKILDTSIKKGVVNKKKQYKDKYIDCYSDD